MFPKISEIELENLRRYHKRGCSNFTRCGVDNIYLDLSTDKKHKLKVLEVCKEFIEKDIHFITEAVPNKSPKRRIDIVNLKTNDWIEIENTGKIKKDANITHFLTKEGWKKVEKI